MLRLRRLSVRAALEQRFQLCLYPPCWFGLGEGGFSPARLKSSFAFLIARSCEGSDVMIWSSVYEAMTLMATCLRPAKKIPSPTSDSSRRYFSSSLKLNVFWSFSMLEGDCFKRIWIDEFVTMGAP